MIVKLGEELDWDYWMRRENKVKVWKAHENFRAETSIGWIEGRKGDYLVEMAPGVRLVCNEETLLKSYVPICDKPDCSERRSGADRRACAGSACQH